MRISYQISLFRSISDLFVFQRVWRNTEVGSVAAERHACHSEECVRLSEKHMLREGERPEQGEEFRLCLFFVSFFVTAVVMSL